MKCTRAIAPAFFVLAMLNAGAAGSEPSWPQFRGPNGTGVATDDKKLPVDFGPARNVLWKTPLPSGHSSPCIWGARIFLSAFDKEHQKLETLCIDRADGRLVWRRTAPAEKIEKVHMVSSPATSTPASDGQRVYLYFGSYGLLCYDFHGNEQWRRPLPTPVTKWGSGASPIVAGELIILNCDEDAQRFKDDAGQPRSKAQSYLLAVDRRSGETLWKTDRPASEASWTTPILWRHGGRNELVVLGSGRLVAYDLQGVQQWEVNGLPFSVIGTPAAGAGMVFAGGTFPGGDPDRTYTLPGFSALLEEHDKNQDEQLGLDEFPANLVVLDRGVGFPGQPGGDITLQRLFGEKLQGIDSDKNGHVTSEEWDAIGKRFARVKVGNAMVAIRPGGRGDVTGSHVVWTERRGVPEVTSPLYYRERLYLVKHGGIVSCLEAKSGRECYRGRLGAIGNYYSSPVAGDGKIYVASDRGVVVVFPPGDTLKVLARNDLHEPIVATPAIVEGKIYVRTAAHLYAFGERTQP